MVDLTTRYLGLDLPSPIVASASPLTGSPETARRIVAAGVGAVVLPSLFEEEVLHEEVELTRALEAGSEGFAESLDYFPALPTFRGAGEQYLDRLEGIVKTSRVPVIASLNASATGSWTRYARWMAEAGAAAIELNLYRVAADATRTSAEIEADDLAIVARVRAEIAIPLAVKLSPYYSAPADVATRVCAAGADGLVLFNRFYQPDVDPETLDVVPRLDLSRAWELRLPLRWIALLRPVLSPGVSLAATSGVASGADVLKAVAAGADVAMMTSALLRHGPGHVEAVEAEVRRWLADRGFGSLAEIRGRASAARHRDASAFERANYLGTLRSWVHSP